MSHRESTYIVQLLLILLLSPKLVHAEAEAPSTVTLYARASLSFTPTEAFFFVSSGDSGGTVRVRGIPVALPKEKSQGSDTPWLVGAKLAKPLEEEDITFSVLISGGGKNFSYLPPVVWHREDHGEIEMSLEALRDLVTKRRDDLKSWTAQFNEQEQSVRRLREDAELVGRVERVRTVEAKIAYNRETLRGLEDDSASLKEFLGGISAEPAPRNFAGREIELTKQIQELASVAKAAESGEHSRRSDAEVRLQEKLRMVEDTRGENLAALKQRLAELGRYRERLERELQGG